MKTARIAALAALCASTWALSSWPGSPAHAGTSYPPETLSTSIVGCSDGEIVVSVDGAKPNSPITIKFDFANIADTEYQVVANAQGFFSGNFPLPTQSDSGAVFTVTINGLDFDPNQPNGVPFQSVLIVDREECPDLPNTGSDSLPIGKAALAVTLAGALLVVIAIRRRPREDTPASV